MITRKEIIEFSDKYGVPAITIDKDYVLGNLVAGIFDNQYLKERLTFKGGTCLKKCYYEDYRFSEDLDFTAIQPIDKKKLNLNLKSIIQKISSQTDILFGKFRIDDDSFQNKLIGYNIKKIPFWGAGHSKNKIPSISPNLPKIKIDITLHEIMCFETRKKKLIHPYSDMLSNHIITCYSIEEIISEKLRAILQRYYRAPRDYYDLWFLLKNESNFDWETIKQSFIEKCKFKNISFYSLDDFFDKNKLMNTEREWDNSLGNHLKVIPKFDLMINELKHILCKIL